jgi:ferritin-like metal-binding protein YciE
LQLASKLTQAIPTLGRFQARNSPARRGIADRFVWFAAGSGRIAFPTIVITERRKPMTAKSVKDVFVSLLSHARQNTERTTKLYDEISRLAEDPQIQESLEARSFVTKNNLAQLDRCFELLGTKPVQVDTRIQEVFAENLRNTLAEIQNPLARRLFILSKAVHLAHLRAAEFVALTAAADVSGHHGVGVLIESSLADHLAFAERTRRAIRNIAESKLADKLAA